MGRILERTSKAAGGCQELSKEFDSIFVPFQNAFNKALSKAPADYWIWDGIHPMPAGHELMAIEWMSQVRKK